MTSSPSRLVRKLAFWSGFLGVISLAVSVLGITALTEFVGAIFAYVPNVIAAVLIFLVAGSGCRRRLPLLATRFMGDAPTRKVVATMAPILVMTITTFMIEQLKIAACHRCDELHTAARCRFTLGSALAFGLGGRDVASGCSRGAYQKGQQNKGGSSRTSRGAKSKPSGRRHQKKDEMERGPIGPAPASAARGDGGVDTGTTQVR